MGPRLPLLSTSVRRPFGFPMDPDTFSEGMWALQAYINSLQSPSQKVCGSIGIEAWGRKRNPPAPDTWSTDPAGCFRNQRKKAFLTHVSHSKNLESLPMSYHFPCARPYALLTRPSLLLTQSKLPKCLHEMLTQSYATQGFAYAEFDMTRSLLKM